MKQDLEKIARALVRSSYSVVLTGAGISTESGLPDFRSRGGLWQDEDAVELLSLQTLYGNPDRFYSKGLALLRTFRDKRPNAAHHAVAKLEQLGVIRYVITQNIDGLHQAAGSCCVLEIHGNLRTATCLGCRTVFPFDLVEKEVCEGRIPPLCPSCGKLVRPDVVLFGDDMPFDFAVAVEECRRAEFMLVVGSSLQVAPAAYLPGMVPHLAIINLDETPYDAKAEVVIRERAGSVLPELVRLVATILHRPDGKTLF